MYAFSFAQALDGVTENGSWEIYEHDRDAKPRASLTSWSLPAKFLGARVATQVSDAMLQLCGGRGYMRSGEIERLVRDSKAGWVMAPSNEVTRQLLGKWALLGPEAVDWWNQQVDEPALQNELGKLDGDGKRRIIEQLSADVESTNAGGVA